MARVMVGDWCLGLLQQLRPFVAHVVDLDADRADGVGAGMGWLRQLQEGLDRGVGIEPVVEALGAMMAGWREAIGVARLRGRGRIALALAQAPDQHVFPIDERLDGMPQVPDLHSSRMRSRSVPEASQWRSLPLFFI